MADLLMSVSNVRLSGSDLEIQVEGDRALPDAIWWEVDPKDVGGASDSLAAFKVLADALDNRSVYATFSAAGARAVGIKCTKIRIQHKSSRS